MLIVCLSLSVLPIHIFYLYICKLHTLFQSDHMPSCNIFCSLMLCIIFVDIFKSFSPCVVDASLSPYPSIACNISYLHKTNQHPLKHYCTSLTSIFLHTRYSGLTATTRSGRGGQISVLVDVRLPRCPIHRPFCVTFRKATGLNEFEAMWRNGKRPACQRRLYRFSLGARVLVQVGTSTGARNVQPQVA